MAARICAPCTFCCRGLGDIFLPDDRPSPIFSTFAVIINIVMIVWSGIELSRQCAAEPKTWVILGILSAVVNIAFAIYLYTRFAYKVRREGVDPGHAACHIFLYDWGVCLYILFVVWLIVWMVFAGRVANDTTNSDNCGNMLVRGIVIFIIYLAVGAVLIAFSICTECCRTPRWKRANASTVVAYPGQATGATAGQHHPYPAQAHGGVFSRFKHSLFGHSSAQPQPQAASGMHATNFSSQQQVPSYYGGGAGNQPPAQNPNYRI